MKYTVIGLLSILTAMFAAPSMAENANAPWGSAPEVERTYSKQKVLYDLTSSSIEEVESVLDRASYLSTLNGADPFDSSIVIVIHGNAIPFFAIKNYPKYKQLMHRAQSLSIGGVIEFRMCKIAAKRFGFSPKDIHGFVTMVPMADAEIVYLQQQGYAYMQ